MKIIVNEPKLINFDNLDSGDIFMCETRYYIKTDESSAVNLETGFLNDSMDDYTVTKVAAVINIGGIV